MDLSNLTQLNTGGTAVSNYVVTLPYAITSGFYYYTAAGSWGSMGGGQSAPMIYSSTGFTSGGSTFSNTLLDSNWPALQLIPHRIELA